MSDDEIMRYTVACDSCDWKGHSNVLSWLHYVIAIHVDEHMNSGNPAFGLNFSQQGRW
jgi:hypothetical protein